MKRDNASRSDPVRATNADSDDGDRLEEEAKAPSTSSVWECSSCTFHNTLLCQQCLMCSTERYGSPSTHKGGAMRKRAGHQRQAKYHHNRTSSASYFLFNPEPSSFPLSFGPAATSAGAENAFPVFQTFTPNSSAFGMGQQTSDSSEAHATKDSQDKIELGSSDHASLRTLSLPQLKGRQERVERELAEAQAAKESLAKQMKIRRSQIAGLIQQKALIQAMVRTKEENLELEQTTGSAQQLKAKLDNEVEQARKELEELNLLKQQRNDELESMKQKEVEVERLKKEYQDMSAKLETIQTEAETLRKKLDEEDVQLQAERDLFNKEKEALAQEKALMNNLQEFKSRKVKLNVGGVCFQTSLSTLTQVPCMFSAMFSGKYRMETDDDGCYFIDRDPTHFRYVLNFLRDSHIEVPIADKNLIMELLVEAEFYQIDGLISLLTRGLKDTSPDCSGANEDEINSFVPDFSFLKKGKEGRTCPLLAVCDGTRDTRSTIPSSTTRIHSRPTFQPAPH